MVTPELRAELGPLAELIGEWEGEQGFDIAPAGDRHKEGRTPFRERITFEQVGPIQNHEQSLHVLRYQLRAWMPGESNTFHEEQGYWSWEPHTQMVMRALLIPRGISMIAGGHADMAAREFTLKSESGSCTFGVCTNPFLDREFKILSFEMNFKYLNDDTFTYNQNTVIQIPGRPEPFNHRDINTLHRVSHHLR